MAENKKMQEKFSRVISNSMKYLNSITDNHLNDLGYIPESMQPYVNEYLRDGRQTFDILSNALDDFDKSSDEYVSVQAEMENIAKTFINVRGQIDKYKNGIGQFKQALGNMNKGTQDSSYYINSAIFGNQWDDLIIDKDGFFNFKINNGEDDPSEGVIKLDHISDVVAGDSPIITEPYIGKKYVFNLAETVKQNKNNGSGFNFDWTYNNVLTNLTDNGPSEVIGMAFTDLAGDGQTKSFAEMYESGLRDENLYIHPQTGEKLPRDTNWMKDKNNSNVVSQLLAKYITNTMKDLYGDIDEEKGVVKKTRADIANELIKKYSKNI
jgi:hypothetical protein